MKIAQPSMVGGNDRRVETKPTALVLREGEEEVVSKPGTQKNILSSSNDKKMSGTRVVYLPTPTVALSKLWYTSVTCSFEFRWYTHQSNARFGCKWEEGFSHFP
jgi:hypothetical protein